ncbi:hypothetical protein NC653_040013 [Populus alba x Populus x berolinensis]|uniref:Protein kinase domain-containing protein n=1 Tax=Populus alba x Populus x berolinensis TaxID=444605 RepID=A0AAD6LF89_9ROSI|nr:hypothetical protein NC653_040013 [Populus alba x Populus x berolinensis]
MAIRANKSRSIFLELNEAQDCTNTFQNLHNRTNLSTCELQDFISSSKTPNLCSKDVDSAMNLLGVERFSALQSNCNNLSTSNYNDDIACYSCGYGVFHMGLSFTGCIHPPGDRMTSILTWQQRMIISLGIARGLWYLHYNPLKKICHGDIELTKILLDEKLEAKISDFNLSRYKSKENTGQEKIANYVFNFGILLLQIMTVRKSTSIAHEARDAVLRKGSLSGLADPRLNGAYDSSAFRNAMSIAVHCTNPSERES